MLRGCYAFPSCCALYQLLLLLIFPYLVLKELSPSLVCRPRTPLYGVCRMLCYSKWSRLCVTINYYYYRFVCIPVSSEQPATLQIA